MLRRLRDVLPPSVCDALPPPLRALRLAHVSAAAVEPLAMLFATTACLVRPLAATGTSLSALVSALTSATATSRSSSFDAIVAANTVPRSSPSRRVVALLPLFDRDESGCFAPLQDSELLRAHTLDDLSATTKKPSFSTSYRSTPSSV
jgi:hypothetical protein